MSGPEKLEYAMHSSPSLRSSHCGGASLHVDRDMYREYERTGVQWATPAKDLHPEGRTHARVRCSADAMIKATEFGPVRYGLCASCSALEMRHRSALKSRAGER